MTIQIIYAGGTFGSYGSPLKPIEAEIFIPELQNLFFDSGLGSVDIVSTIVKDSSEFSSLDFFEFYQLILKSYAEGCEQFIFITGTDTLSYLGAFLAEAFVNSDICIAITASMKPLFECSETDDFIVNRKSDAWPNLSLAITTVKQSKSGVRTCIQNESWNAESIKKIHSHELKAFKGNYNKSYPINTYQSYKDIETKNQWMQERLELLPSMDKRATNFNITPIFLMPNNQQWLVNHISTTVEIAEKLNEVAYVILMSYGAGNLPFSDELCQLFDKITVSGHVVIATTQCSFGGVSSDYESGSWQYEHGILSSGNISIELIFARLYWLHLSFGAKNSQIKARWNTLLISSTNIDSST